MRYYVALVRKDVDSDFGVSFPDFPGCVSAGATLGEVAAMASEALSGHIGLMADEELPVPEPSDLDEILADPDSTGSVPILVPAATGGDAQAVRINVTMPEDILTRLDAYVEQHGLSRSGFLTQAAKKAMDSA